MRKHCALKPFSTLTVEFLRDLLLGLFSLYLNNFLEACPDVNIHIYAGDTGIYIHAKITVQVVLKLSSAMTKL